MSDVIEYVHNSIIQHEEYNDRIYLIKLSRQNTPAILIKALTKIALDKGYSKIFAKVPAYAEPAFKKNGFHTEAFIPQFYNGFEDVYFMGKYFSHSRQLPHDSTKINQIIKIAYSKSGKAEETILSPPLSFKICDTSHALYIAKVYQKVFKTYPFPIYDPKYVLKTMNNNVIYFSIRRDDEIIALSSAEMDIESQNVEMTDFATLHEYRGKALALYLLAQMENEMVRKGYQTAYTIARSLSFGMNITFAKRGYLYGGTLINNTNICGKLESMNVWYKFL